MFSQATARFISTNNPIRYIWILSFYQTRNFQSLQARVNHRICRTGISIDYLNL